MHKAKLLVALALLCAPLPALASGANSGQVPDIVMGTSTSGANPHRTGDASTGHYSATTGAVDVSANGTKVAEFLAGGEQVTGTLGVSGLVTLSGGLTETGAVTLSSLSDGCLYTVSHVLTSTGTACGSGSGGITSVFGRSTSSITAQTGDYTVSQITGAAPLASPTFTGTVTLPAGQAVNGVTLTTGGASSAFLNGAGSYSTPSSNVSSATGVLPTTNGGSGSAGIPALRSKLFGVAQNSGNLRLCLAGDSTTFGSWSTSANNGDLVATSYPSYLASYIYNNMGIRANRNAFLGDGGGTETNGSYNGLITIGGWSQDATIVSLGGATFKTTAVAGTALTFTPNVPVNTFRFLYIITPGAGTLQAQVDTDTTVTYNTAGTAGIGVATLTAAGGVGTHSIKFTMSAGTQVNLIGVSDAYDSTQSWADVINMGWAGAKAGDWSAATSAYSPGNAAAWSALACDFTIFNLAINDWDASTTTSAYSTSMQTLITDALQTGGAAIMTPVPSVTTAATQARQQLFVNAMYSLVQSNAIGLFDIFNRWQTYVNGNAAGLYASGGGGIHPDAAGYAENAYSILTALNSPGQPDNVLGNTGQGTTSFTSAFSTTISSGSSVPFTATAASSQNSIVTTTANTLGDTIQYNDTSNSGQLTAGISGSAFANCPKCWYVQGLNGHFFGSSATIFAIPSNSEYGWTSATGQALTTPDTGISRDSAGVTDFGNGTVGNASGSIKLTSVTATGTVKLGGFTVSTLPTGTVGMTAYVTDATSCTFLGTLTGSGSTFCPVVYNGTAWVGH